MKAHKTIKGEIIFTMGPVADGSYIVRREYRHGGKRVGQFRLMPKGETIADGLTKDKANEIVEVYQP